MLLREASRKEHAVPLKAEGRDRQEKDKERRK